MRTRLTTCGLALAIFARPLGAQDFSSSTWLQWTTFDVFIAADSVRGVGLWALPIVGQATTRMGRVDGDYFAPADVLGWARSADSVLNARYPNPKDPRTSIASSLLPDLSGGGVMVLRHRLGDRWDGDPVLAFVDSLGHPRAVMRGEKRIGRSFVAALRAAAEASSIRDVGSEFTQASSCEVTYGAPGVTNASTATMPALSYPRGRPGTDRAGFVLATFVVDSMGQLVEPSLVVRFANEQRFRDAAVAALTKATFRPATRDGRAVSQCVKQFIYWCAP